MAQVFQNQEPLQLTGGDTLCFQKYLPDYLPSAGWSCVYELRMGNGGGNPLEIISTPDATNTFHQLLVTSAVTATWPEGEYILAGFVTRTNNNVVERHRIYYGTLPIGPDLGDAANDDDVTTYAQQMVTSLQATLLQLNQNFLLETSIENTRILREKRIDVRKELNFWEERRQNEIAVQNVANGRPSGNTIRPVIAIVGQGAIVGSGPTWPFAS